jgi:hypothetical protein
MVVSRSDSKRRKKEGADSLQESPKRYIFLFIIFFLMEIYPGSYEIKYE